jgi:hypothetical protein
MNNEKVFLSAIRTPSASAGVIGKGNRPAQPRAAQFISDREGNLPVWVRAPKFGHEFYSGFHDRSFTNGRQRDSFAPFPFANQATSGASDFSISRASWRLLNDARPVCYRRDKSADAIKYFIRKNTINTGRHVMQYRYAKVTTSGLKLLKVLYLLTINEVVPVAGLGQKK